ncbi:MAG TPA: hypothetical protein VFX97_11265 [Pyrinomonadaceae bacterium]|nr:hypothetical protein [Pyrinomonadaceae bacterium]
MAKITRRWLAVPLIALVVFISAFELWHRSTAGHFVAYGAHTHLLRDPANIGIPGINSMYAVDVFNYGLLPISLKGCKQGSDISPYYEIVYRYQLERWDPSAADWKQIISLKASDCPKEALVSSTLWPGQSVRIVDWEATAATDGLRVGDNARFVAHALFDTDDNSAGQKTFISQPFPIDEEPTDRSTQYRIKH